MAHWVGNTSDFNGFIRQVRACLLDAPRVKRSTTKDISVTGYVYNNISDVARGQSDVGFAIAETGAHHGVYRATCVKAGGTASWGAGQSVTVTISAGAGGTIILDDNSSWVTKGFAAGDLIKIEDAVDTVNNNVFRISTITTTSGTNDTITVTSDDTLAAETSDTITAYAIGNGGIFEVERDTTGNGTVDTHIGWIASNVENYDKSFLLHLLLNRGNADWVVGDYWEFELEHGPLTYYDQLTVTVEDVVITGTNTLTLSDVDQLRGITWAGLGFSDENRIDIVVSSGTDTGIYRIDAITDSALTLQTTAGGAPGLTNETVTIQVVPKFEVSSDPVLNVVPTDPTITRDDVGGSWIDDGFLVGGHIQLEGTASNDGYWLIKTVTDTVLTLDDSGNGPALVTETLPTTITVTPRNGSLQAWTEHRFRLKSSGTTTTSSDDAISSSGVANGLLIRPDSDNNYVTEWIGIGPGIDSINNPQTVYIGMQSQFLGANRQNIEHRVFDVVSDASFSLMLSGYPNARAYSYMSAATVMETCLEFDGDHIVGFADDAASVEWFYQGYTAVYGTDNQHPRPLFNGASGIDGDDTRATSNGLTLNFLFDPISRSSSSSFETDPEYSSAWFRWVDGQYFGVFHRQVSNSELSELTVNPNKVALYPYCQGTKAVDSVNSQFWGGSNNQEALSSVLGRTPSTFDPTDRHFVMLPITLWMESPTANVIGELKGVYHIPGVGGLSTIDRQTKGHRVFYMGHNHKDTSANDFAALELT
jgi:hypothetical protein